MKKIKTIFLFPLFLLLLTGVIKTEHASAEEKNNIATKNIMVYYRAWRDKEMHGVNTNLPDENWMTMYDIPYGVNIVNVFSYVPKGEEVKAQPFFDKLKTDYAPYLHKRNIKLVRGFDYSLLLKVPHKGDFPTDEEFDTYAKQIINDMVTPWGLDGVDIDMEAFPSSDEVKLSDGVIRSLSKYLGPKANNGTLLFYDTNNFNTKPMINVAECFDILPFQQYGQSDDATKKAFDNFSPIIGSDKILPGLTFPEEQDHNRWYDTDDIYENSNIYKVAKYVYKNNLSGMFLYSFDRDGKTYSDHDLNTISPSDFLWTKTAILEANGVPLDYAKQLAIDHVKRIRYIKGFSKSDVDNLILQINNSKNIRDVNMVLLGKNIDIAKDSTYDPILEHELSTIDLSNSYISLDKADDILSKVKNINLDTVIELQKNCNTLKQIIGGKSYTTGQVSESLDKLNNAISNISKPIIIKYLDETGNDLTNELTIRGNFGEVYRTKSKDIDGYTLNKIEGNVTGNFTEEPQIVKYIYKTNQNKTSNVSVEYLDNNGKEIHKKQILKGKLGDFYDVTTEQYKININGYKLDLTTTPNNARGTFAKHPQIVKYIYKKNESSLHKQAYNNHTNKNTDHNNKQQSKLPSTGEKIINFLPVTGVSIILLTLLYVLSRKRSK